MTLEQIQAFLDAGYSANRIAKYFGVDHKRIDRLIKYNGLEKYIAFDEIEKYKPSFWMYDENFKIGKSEYGYADRLDCIRDAIGEFLRLYDPDEITIPLLEKHRHIRHYSYELFGSLPAMYKYYGIDKTAVEYSMNKKARSCATHGHIFQKLVKKVFDELCTSYLYEQKVDGCRPDFISEGYWYDAKLSRSTAFNKSCETIDKYSKHTDYLTIIYAIDDTNADDDRANFVHITEYYPYISEGLRRKIDAFIRKASEVKFGESNRL